MSACKNQSGFECSTIKKCSCQDFKRLNGASKTNCIKDTFGVRIYSILDSKTSYSAQHMCRAPTA